MPETSFPQAHCTYILILRLQVPAELTVGKLGTFPFAAGWYAYVGSAFGSGGLRGRLGHHLAQTKRLHWHIDYLTQSASIDEIWYAASEIRYEHDWAVLLALLPDTCIPVDRFGASDCKCQSHLFYCPTLLAFDTFHQMAHDDVERAVRPYQI